MFTDVYYIKKIFFFIFFLLLIIYWLDAEDNLENYDMHGVVQNMCEKYLYEDIVPTQCKSIKSQKYLDQENIIDVNYKDVDPIIYNVCDNYVKLFKNNEKIIPPYCIKVTKRKHNVSKSNKQ